MHRDRADGLGLHSVGRIAQRRRGGEFKKQILYMLLGVPLMLGVSFVDYRNWQRWAPRSTSSTCCLLLFICAAVTARSARSAGSRSVRSARSSPRSRPSSSSRSRWRRCSAAAATRICKIFGSRCSRSRVPALLILKQPDLGTTLVLLAILTVELFFALPKLGDFGIYALGMLVVAAAAVGTNAVLKPFQRARLFVFLNPKADPQGAGYNLNQSKIAVGNGEWFGRGLYHGTQTQLNFVPEHSRDFIFTVLGRRVGFRRRVRLLGALRRAAVRRRARDARRARPLRLSARGRPRRDALLSHAGQHRNDDRHHADHGHSAAVHVVRRLRDADRLRALGILLNIYSQRDRDVLGNA